LADYLEFYKQSNIDVFRNINTKVKTSENTYALPTTEQIAARALQASAILQTIEGLLYLPDMLKDILEREARLQAALEEARTSKISGAARPRY
jgi:hypothetical protein